MWRAALNNASVKSTIGALVVVFGLLILGTWVTAKLTINSLLDQGATSTAQKWARFLVANIGDLEQIAAGERPSTASMYFFKAAQKSGDVFRYEIFNREGYSQLISDAKSIRLVDLSQYSAEAARSLSTGQPIVDTIDGGTAGWPAFYARAYLPIVADQRVLAIVAAEPGHRIAASDHHAQALRDGFEHEIAAGVSINVVEILKAVDVDEMNREAAAAERQCGKGLVQCFDQMGAVL